MQANRLKAAWGRGEKTVNGWCAIPSSFSAEVMARQGWDSITIDTQHGLVGYQAMTEMLRGIDSAGVPALVRVPWGEPAWVMKALDAGASGIICPMIDSVAEARAFASWCRYPPLGMRSFGPIRANVIHGADYAARANDEVLALAMIETKPAFEGLEAILDTPGLDGIYIGPNDLAASLGMTPCLDPEEEGMLKAIETIVKTTKARGKIAAIHTASTSYAKRMHALGFDQCTIHSDARMIAAMSQATLDEMRADGAGGGTGGGY